MSDDRADLILKMTDRLIEIQTAIRCPYPGCRKFLDNPLYAPLRPGGPWDCWPVGSWQWRRARLDWGWWPQEGPIAEMHLYCPGHFHKLVRKRDHRRDWEQVWRLRRARLAERPRAPLWFILESASSIGDVIEAYRLVERACCLAVLGLFAWIVISIPVRILTGYWGPLW